MQVLNQMHFNISCFAHRGTARLINQDMLIRIFIRMGYIRLMEQQAAFVSSLMAPHSPAGDVAAEFVLNQIRRRLSKTNAFLEMI